MTKAPTKDRLAALRKQVKGQPTKRATRVRTPKSVAVVVKTAPTPVKKDEIAYVIEDKVFGELRVKASANAWWMERGKLEALINAYKYDCTHEEASISAGISIDQLKYFIERHPEFSTVITTCREVPNLKARQTVVGALATDTHIAFKYLERKKPGEFAIKTPQVAVQINMGERVEEDREAYT